MYTRLKLSKVPITHNWPRLIQQAINRVILLNNSVVTHSDSVGLDLLKVYVTDNALCILSESMRFMNLYNKWNKFNPSAHAINIFEDLLDSDDNALVFTPDIPILSDVLGMLSEMMSPDFSTYWEGLSTLKHYVDVDTTDLFMVCTYGETEYYVIVDGLEHMTTQTETPLVFL